MTNRSWEFKFPYFPVMPYDRYKYTIAISNKAGAVVGLIVADVSLVPRV